METTMKAGLVSTNATSDLHTKILSHTNSLFWKKVEFNRFAIIPMLLVIIGCVGGFAAAFGAGADTFRLSLIAFPTIITLAITLAVAPMRWIFCASIIALILDVMVLIF